MNDYILAPSLLSADFSNLANAIKMIEDRNAKFVHIDVMDGSFVPQISYGQPVVKSLRPLTNLVFDVHLMIDHPENHIQSFADSGADYITFHVESESDVNATIEAIKKTGAKVGLSVKPNTPFEAVKPYMDKIDMLLIMTVEPGFGGQSFIMEMLEKISDARNYINENNLKQKYNFLSSFEIYNFAFTKIGKINKIANIIAIIT